MLLGMWCDPSGHHVQGQELNFNGLCGFFTIIVYEMRRDTAQAPLLADSMIADWLFAFSGVLLSL